MNSIFTLFLALLISSTSFASFKNAHLGCLQWGEILEKIESGELISPMEPSKVKSAHKRVRDYIISTPERLTQSREYDKQLAVKASRETIELCNFIETISQKLASSCLDDEGYEVFDDEIINFCNSIKIKKSQLSQLAF